MKSRLRPAGPGTVMLIGPQHDTPDIGAVLKELGITGKVALVRAGYQEREAEDKDIVTAIGLPTVNLRLHARALEVFAGDTTFKDAYHARQNRLRHVQNFYRIRLEKIEDGARSIGVRHVDAELLEQEAKVSVDQFRNLDLDHIERCVELRRLFVERMSPAERPLIAKARESLRTELASCSAIVIAGGHVASLLNRLALFDVLHLAAGKPIVAWSAGAMILTDRIILFHDYPPYGSDIAQVLDAGFGLAPGIVVLPDPERRVRLDAREGIQQFSRRMAPATCVAMAHGSRVRFDNGVLVSASAARLTTSGDVDGSWTGKPSRFSSPNLRARS